MTSTAVIVLAAGASRRLGRPKQLLPFGGTTLLRHAVRSALDSGCRPVVVVLGCRSEEMAPQLDGLPVRLALNPDWREGMSSSIRSGLQALQGVSDATDSVILMTCDQPAVNGELLDRLADAQRRSGSPVAACRYAGVLGVPALFCASLYPELEALRGDQGARAVLRRHSRQAASVDFPQGEYDIDRPEDVAGERSTGNGERTTAEGEGSGEA